MPRIIEIVSPYEKTDALEKEINNVKGVLNLQMLRQASVQPPGDVLQVTIPNRHLQELMRVLDRSGLGQENGISLNSSQPGSVITTGLSYRIDRDSNEATWEEMEMIISKGSNANVNTLLIMAIAGSLAIAGIVTNTLHIVIGGMLVAPGFMPIIRIPLGLVARHEGWYRGLIDVLKGYGALISGAVLTTLAMQAMGYDVVAGATSYHVMDKKLLEYWTTIDGPGLLASAVSALAGAILLATNRSIFTSGVMIGLALVPAAALIGLALTVGHWELAGKAFLRFGLDVLLVLVIPLLFFYRERVRIHQRDMHF
jgi:hypothetical protein